MPRPDSALSGEALAARLKAARANLDALADALDDEAWVGPYAPHVNPPLWEYGHVAWFQEHWCLRLKSGRHPAESPLTAPLEPARIDWADWRYNSSHIPHAARWRAPYPTPAETRAYGAAVLDAVCGRLARTPDDADLRYYAELSLHHESMHTEAWWMMWQWHGRRPPEYPRPSVLSPSAGVLRVDAGTCTLGAAPGAGFAFDNEKWAHEVDVAAFEIDARPVLNAEFAAFVDAGGYTNDASWSPAGRAWRDACGARHPLYWRRGASGWEVRRFDRWLPLPEDEPVLHVSRYEAEAWAAWRGRRLPSAAEWLRAAALEGFVRGDCWEWTADLFAPYPGFEPDPYADYSAPWFHTHAEVRGAGSRVTDAALARPGFRNFYTPERRDPFVGFRTAAASPA